MQARRFCFNGGMLVVLAWLVAAAACAFAWLLAFAHGMAAAPRFPRSARIVAGLPSMVVLLLAGGLGFSADHGWWVASGPMLLAAFGCAMAFAPITSRRSALASSSRQTTRGRGPTLYRDTAHNLRITAKECDEALNRQAAGLPPPTGVGTWDQHWQRYEEGLRRWQLNPDPHIELVRAARRAGAAAEALRARG